MTHKRWHTRDDTHVDTQEMTHTLTHTLTYTDTHTETLPDNTNTYIIKRTDTEGQKKHREARKHCIKR